MASGVTGLEADPALLTPNLPPLSQERLQEEDTKVTGVRAIILLHF